MFVYYGVKLYLAYLLIMYFACQYENPKADKPMFKYRYTDSLLDFRPFVYQPNFEMTQFG